MDGQDVEDDLHGTVKFLEVGVENAEKCQIACKPKDWSEKEYAHFTWTICINEMVEVDVGVIILDCNVSGIFTSHVFVF